MDFCSLWVDEPSQTALQWVDVPGNHVHEARCCQERGKSLAGQGPLAPLLETQQWQRAPEP